MPIIRKRLTLSELQAPNTRYNPETNQMEITLDGGETWTPDPNSDPRENPALIIPVTGDPCPRAGGMVAGIQGLVDGINNATTAGALATNLLGYALLWTVVATPVAIALLVADTVFLYGQLALINSFTPTRKEQVQCIFDCNMPEDGIITDEIWTVMTDAVAAEIGSGDLNTLLDLWRTLEGTVGITNAATIAQDPEADCSECTCDCTGTSVQFFVDDEGFVNHAWDIFAALGTWASDVFGVGWYAGNGGGNNQIGISGTVAVVCGTGVAFEINRTAVPTSAVVKFRITTATQTKTATVTNPGTGSNTAFWNEGGFLEEDEGVVEIGYDGDAGFGVVMGAFQTGNI